MVEENSFFRYYITILFDLMYEINIRIYDNRMYINHSMNLEVLDDIRQWKSQWK